MNSRITIAALAAIIASSLPAQAAPPKVSGKYAVLSLSLCSARIKAATVNSHYSVSSTENGVLAVLNGYATFTSTSATAGNVALNLTQTRGPNTTVNAPSLGWSQTAVNQSGSYTVGASSMVIAGGTYVATYGEIVSGIAKTVNLSRREPGNNQGCLDAITLTRTQ
jgi:hypothetical protein